MKYLGILLLCSGCGSLGLGTDAAGNTTVTDSESGAVLTVPPAEVSPETGAAAATGNAVGGIVGALTGNPGIGLAVGGIAAALLALKAKKKPAA